MTLKAWAVVSIEPEYKIAIPNIRHYARPLEKWIEPWAIFTTREEAEEASQKGTPAGGKTKVVEVEIGWDV